VTRSARGVGKVTPLLELRGGCALPFEHRRNVSYLATTLPRGLCPIALDSRLISVAFSPVRDRFSLYREARSIEKLDLRL